MVPFAGLLAALKEIPDPRRRQGRRYGLAPLLLFSVLAVLAGATSYRRIRLFIGVHRQRRPPPLPPVHRRPSRAPRRPLRRPLPPRPRRQHAARPPARVGPGGAGACFP